MAVNGTITDLYDYSQAPSYIKATLSGIGYYALALSSFYSATNNDYYLRKLQVIIDAFISDPWFTVSTDRGLARDVKCYWYDGLDHDSSALLTAIAGIISLRLYQWIGDAKYKAYADEIAYQSRNLFPAVDNATDLGWVFGYYKVPRTEANAKYGVNRQGALAYFYAVYSQYNSSFGAYVPLILNWVWRSQVDNGGMTYNIGEMPVNPQYTAFATWFAMCAYSNVPSQFSTALMAKINNTVTWLTQIAGTAYYLTDVIIAGALAMAIKSNFIAPTSVTIEKTKTYLYGSLKSLTYGQKGISTSIDDYPEGSRWAQLHLGALLSLYPLPPILQFFNQPYIAFTNYANGRYRWQGLGLDLFAEQRIYVGDDYDNNGIDAYPFSLLVTHQGVGVKSRSLANVYGVVRTWLNYSTVPRGLTYIYPDSSVFSNVTGTSKIYIWVNYQPTKLGLRVANGSEYDLENLSTGIHKLSSRFLIWVQNVGLTERYSVLVQTSETDSWSFSKDANTATLQTASITDYNVSMAYTRHWCQTINTSATFSLLGARADRISTLDPLTYDEILANWNAETQSRNPEPTWYKTYEAATNSGLELLFHNLPQTVTISQWNCRESILAFTISTPSGTKSVTKLHCGDKGKPREIRINGALAVEGIDWTYVGSVRILTINATAHSNEVHFIIRYLLGDVNGDGWVDIYDVKLISERYGAREGEVQYEPEIDLDGDGAITVFDLMICGQNYGTSE
jgi:hypothetical protein